MTTPDTKALREIFTNTNLNDELLIDYFVKQVEALITSKVRQQIAELIKDTKTPEEAGIRLQNKWAELTLKEQEGRYGG